MPSKGSIAALIFGVSLFSGLSLFGLYYFFRNRGVKNEKSLTMPVAIKTTKPKSEETEVTVEDVNDDESDTEGETTNVKDVKNSVDGYQAKEDEETAAREAAELKQKYEEVVNLASKLVKGNAYLRAAEKFSDAIALAQQIPNVRKNLVVLYNNRSAMYEKAGQLDDSLLDIDVVLAMDSHHQKARLRRARIYQTQVITIDKIPEFYFTSSMTQNIYQGNLQDSLNDFVVSMLMDQERAQRAGAPPDHSTIETVDKICKELAASETVKFMKKFRASVAAETRDLPSKAYCKNFLEFTPAVYRWKEELQTVDRWISIPRVPDTFSFLKLSHQIYS